jgi:hypothetical protein
VIIISDDDDDDATNNKNNNNTSTLTASTDVKNVIPAASVKPSPSRASAADFVVLSDSESEEEIIKPRGTRTRPGASSVLVPTLPPASASASPASTSQSPDTTGSVNGSGSLLDRLAARRPSRVIPDDDDDLDMDMDEPPPLISE